MPEGYTVHHHQHGIVVTGPMPVEDMADLMDLWVKRGFKLIAQPIMDRMQATIAVVKSEADLEAWRKEIGATPENPNWLLSGDTGISSKTIYATMTGQWHCFRRGMDDARTPADPSDFGRCHRLLIKHPEFRPRLPEVAEKFPAWVPLVREWDRMTALYERDLKTGESRELYDLMRALVDEGRA